MTYSFTLAGSAGGCGQQRWEAVDIVERHFRGTQRGHNRKYGYQREFEKKKM